MRMMIAICLVLLAFSFGCTALGEKLGIKVPTIHVDIGGNANVSNGAVLNQQNEDMPPPPPDNMPANSQPSGANSPPPPPN